MILPRAPMPALFEAQTARTPNAAAVAFDGEELTFAELNVRANQLAHYLVALRVAPEHFVAVALPQSLELVVALLAVLKAGAAYLPVDPHYPAKRTAHVLRDCRPSVVVSTAGAARTLPTARGVPLVLLDDPDTAHAIDRCPVADLADADRNAPLSLLNPAYVIYTSGSMGTPKGVVIEHRSLTDYLAWTSRSYRGVRGVSVVPTSIAFDLTVTGLYTPLVTGGCVHLVPMPGYSPADVDRLRRVPCTFLKVTPSHLGVLTALPDELSPRDELLLGGEALVGSAVAEWRRRHPGVTVLNVYGPTEATVNCAEHRIEPGTEILLGPVPIGRPQAGARLYVLDGGLRQLPSGRVGELFIGGTGLARGYLDMPHATAESFLPDPFGRPGARMYRTGDLVRRLDDGNLVFVGRADDQVKVRGFRVELGEVEGVLARRTEIAQVACAVRGGSPGAERLVAYVVPRHGDVVSAAAVRRYAGATLPSYMVPSDVVVLTDLPRTPNGKVDRNALPDPTVHGEGPADGEGPGLGERAARGSGRLAAVLPLRRSGSLPPLFCVHADSGVGWAYRGLLASIATHRPVYALQAPWLEAPEARPTSIGDAAVAYLRHIRDVQPEGPYHLLGASFGGLVAHAIATRLQAAGARVSFLAVLGASPDAAHAAAGEEELSGLLASLRRDRLGGGEPAPSSPVRGSGLDDVFAIVRVWRDCHRLTTTFVPDRFDGDMHFFAADRGTRPAPDARRSWAPYVRGNIVAQVIDCAHDDLTEPGPLAVVGPIVATALDNA